jgi:hypothetical protein
VWAPPGRYTVVLEVDGARLTQPLTLAPDPRIQLPPAGYAAQFALARRIEETQTKVDGASGEADALISALVERRKGASADLGAAIDALQARALEISGALVSKNPNRPWWLAPTSTTSLRFLSGALGGLANAVGGSDDAPSPDAVAGFEKLRTMAAPALAAWEALKAKDLAALNAKLKAAGLPVVSEP